MSTKPWYPWYVGDARAKMRGLTLDQRGAYRELLDECYIRGGAIPADRESLWRIADAHTPSERAAVDFVAAKFFERRGDVLVNKRVEKEIGRSRELSEYGSLGGKATQAKAKAEREAEAKANGKAEHVPEAKADLQAPQPQPQLQPQSTTTAIEPLRPSRAKTRSSTPGAAETWDAYETAYVQRYATKPVRNAQVNAQIRDFVKAVGATEAPQIAAWYLGHNRTIYVKASHSVGLLKQHASGLRTEWARDHRMTDTEARQRDQTQATGSVFEKLIREAETPAQIVIDASDNSARASEPGPWWRDDEALIYFGSEIGVAGVAGEGIDTYRLRCIAAAGPGEWRQGLSTEEAARVRSYELNGVNPPRGVRQVESHVIGPVA